MPSLGRSLACSSNSCLSSAVSLPFFVLFLVGISIHALCLVQAPPLFTASVGFRFIVLLFFNFYFFIIYEGGLEKKSTVSLVLEV